MNVDTLPIMPVLNIDLSDDEDDEKEEAPLLKLLQQIKNNNKEIEESIKKKHFQKYLHDADTKYGLENKEIAKKFKKRWSSKAKTLESKGANIKSSADALLKVPRGVHDKLKSAGARIQETSRVRLQQLVEIFDRVKGDLDERNAELDDKMKKDVIRARDRVDATMAQLSASLKKIESVVNQESATIALVKAFVFSSSN